MTTGTAALILVVKDGTDHRDAGGAEACNAGRVRGVAGRGAGGSEEGGGMMLGFAFPFDNGTTTTSNYVWNTNYSGSITVAVEYFEQPLIPPMKISDGALKSWRIWMAWARALPRYRCLFFRPQMRAQKSTWGRPYARARGHAFGHSPRRSRR